MAGHSVDSMLDGPKRERQQFASQISSNKNQRRGTAIANDDLGATNVSSSVSALANNHDRFAPFDPPDISALPNNHRQGS